MWSLLGDSEEHDEVSALLVMAGSPLNAKDADGMNPIMYAARCGKIGPLRQMLSRANAASLSACDSIGRRALHHACAAGSAAAVEVCRRPLPA